MSACTITCLQVNAGNDMAANIGAAAALVPEFGAAGTEFVCMP
jgi:hypothetical protein